MLNHNLYQNRSRIQKYIKKYSIFALFEVIFLFVLFYTGFLASELSEASPKTPLSKSSKSQGFSLHNALSFDKNLPVDIQSDSAHFDEKTGNTVYEGNVSVTQAEHALTSETLTLHRTKEGQIDYIKATGTPAHFLIRNHPEETKNENEGIYVENDSNTLRGQANIIHYYPMEKKIVLLKNAELSQDEQFIRGGTLIYYLESKVLISERDNDSKTVIILKPKPSAKLPQTTANTSNTSNTQKRDHYELFRSR